jgi:hypothetical protein
MKTPKTIAPRHWEANYKSMSYEQLLEVYVPTWLTDHKERAAFIANELQLKKPAK